MVMVLVMVPRLQTSEDCQHPNSQSLLPVLCVADDHGNLGEQPSPHDRHTQTRRMTPRQPWLRSGARCLASPTTPLTSTHGTLQHVVACRCGLTVEGLVLQLVTRMHTILLEMIQLDCVWDLTVSPPQEPYGRRPRPPQDEVL